MPNFLHDPQTMSLVFGGAAFLVVVLVWVALLEDAPLETRLKSVSQLRSSYLEEQRRKKNTPRRNVRQLSLMKRVVEMFKLAKSSPGTDLRLKLKRAGHHSPDAITIFLFSKVAATCLGGALGALLVFVFGVGGGDPETGLVYVVMACIAGWYTPELILKNQRQKREELMRRAMPDALDLMVICAEAGLGLDAAFDRVGREIAPSYPALAEEIGLTSVELNFLPERAKAIQGLAERIPLASMTALVNTLLQSEKYGTPLAQALRVLSAEMRDERMMRAEEKAARLPAMLTVPMMIFILPPLFIVLVGPAVISVMAMM